MTHEGIVVLQPGYKKNTQNLDQKFNQRQNTVCLEQQIYASQENFTPTLLVMLETFRRSVPILAEPNSIWLKYLNIVHFSINKTVCGF